MKRYKRNAEDLIKIVLFFFLSRQLKRFCIDKYANYVVQKLIDLVEIAHIQILFQKIQPFYDEMQRHVCGRNIFRKIFTRLSVTLPFQFQALSIAQ